MDQQQLSHLLALPDERPHIHHFHSYPARFSPALVAGLLADVRRGSVVFDPFAGSGTTLVEARLRGCAAWGNDLNPLAALLCRVKARPLSPKDLAFLERDLAYLRKYIGTRLRSRGERQHVRMPPGERLFHPHVFWQLQTIVGGIERLRNPHHREIMLAALSAIVNRVSLQARDSRPDRRVQRSVGSRGAAMLFQQAAEELLVNLRTFSRRCENGALRVWQNDARELADVPDASVDVIVTSPPYGGTYDYAEMHALRNLWLTLDWAPFERLEIGARRRQRDRSARADLEADLTAVFTALARVSHPDTVLYWVIADGVIHGKAYRGDRLSADMAARAGWRVHAVGDIERPIWSGAERKAYRERGKCEYLMEFRRQG